jgi:hypothetical protein
MHFTFCECPHFHLVNRLKPLFSKLESEIRFYVHFNTGKEAVNDTSIETNSRSNLLHLNNFLSPFLSDGVSRSVYLLTDAVPLPF